jgi:hypothetical protein
MSSRRGCAASYTLSEALKRSAPFHSPRYIGHMASDMLLSGLEGFRLLWR